MPHTLDKACMTGYTKGMSDVYMEMPRLLLRHWREADVEPFAWMNADPEVMRFFPEPYSREKSNCFSMNILREFSDYGYGLYAVEEKATGLFMGYTGFHRMELELDFCPCTEIGWRLDKDFWDKGYATEGAKACLEHGFSRLGFDTVYSFTSRVNLPSERVMKKIGMRMERHFEHPGVPQNHPLRPHILYMVTAD